jgi:hypothetical protein
MRASKTTAGRRDAAAGRAPRRGARGRSKRLLETGHGISLIGAGPGQAAATLAAIGMRQPRPNPRRPTFGPGAAWRRFHSARRSRHGIDLRAGVEGGLGRLSRLGIRRRRAANLPSSTGVSGSRRPEAAAVTAGKTLRQGQASRTPVFQRLLSRIQPPHLSV